MLRADMDQETDVTEFAPAWTERVGPGLLEALVVALNGLEQETDLKFALTRSFESATEALGAERSLLARVNDEGMITEVLVATGLTPALVQALCEGTSVRGVSVSVVRDALKSRDVQLVEDARQRQGADLTMALRGEEFSVLCAAVRDPYSGVPRAVVYWQSMVYARPYTEEYKPWVAGYARTLSGVLRLWESGERRVAAAQAAVASGGSCTVVGDSAATRTLKEALRRIYLPLTERPHPEPILVLGETGTGKDLVARYLHTYSQRRGRHPFVAENCSLITGTVESRLLGHVKGSFTDAGTDAPGLFRAADGGVLFLDEIGDLPPQGQAALLRVIETRMVRPFGGTKETPVDVQIVLATNKDLPAMIAKGEFREDLYQRFQGMTIQLKPLRERPEDVHPLLSHFLGVFQERQAKVVDGLAPELWELLISYDWPGNAREMATLCAVLVAHTPHREMVTAAVLRNAKPALFERMSERKQEVKDLSPLGRGSLEQVMSSYERSYLKQCLSEADRQKMTLGGLAEVLGVGRTTLYRRMVAYGLNADELDAVSPAAS